VLGGAATVTGIGVAVGVPAMVVSTTLVVGGAGNIAAGIRGLTQSMMSKGSGTTPSRQRGIGGKGWRGDAGWKEAVRNVDKGGTIRSIGGNVTTKQEAIDLITEAGGKILRIEGPHAAPNPHNFTHINYLTSGGLKGTIEIIGL
jgi:hypothetical protein